MTVIGEDSASPETDVLVLGSGATGLVAALAAYDHGAQVKIVEKAPTVGGTTSLSGGVAWIPANPLAAAEGRGDSVAAGITYLTSLSNGLIDKQLLEALVATGPRFVDWLHDSTPARLTLLGRYPDYHPENPGGLAGGGRSLEPTLFEFERLGSWAGRVTPNAFQTRVEQGEQPIFSGPGVTGQELERRAHVNARGGGEALVGSLLLGCLERGITPLTQTRAEELIVEADGVRGAAVRTARGREEIRAGAGVVIATGGFAGNPELVRRFLRGPMEGTAGVPWNVGDGLRMAMRAGAALGTMGEAWWTPIIRIPGDQHFGAARSVLVLRERTLPGSIMVNRTGRRFANEAANYNALGGAFHHFDPGSFRYANLPAWLIFGGEYLRRYGFRAVGSQGPLPGWIRHAESLACLAEEIGVPADALIATVARFNRGAARGEDPDFRRGESAYDLYNGDQAHPGPFATLGPVEGAPFCAVEIHIGALGTKGGPVTDADARVLDVDGNVIPGLYAVGNAMAGVTGMVYGGAGGTLGPGMVFGYRAGVHVGQRASSLVT